MRSVSAVALAIGVPLLLAVGGGIWRVARLQSDTIRDFRSRLIIAQVGLDDRAASALRSLAEDVNEVLGGAEDAFDPTLILGNPDLLQTSVDEFNQCMRARRRLPSNYKGLLRVGPLLLSTLAPLFAAILVSLTYFSGWRDDRLVGYVALWIAVVLSGAAALTAAYYILVQWRFSQGEILSQEEPP